MNFESCTSSNLCFGQMFEEEGKGKKGKGKKKEVKGGVGVNAFIGIMQSLQTSFIYPSPLEPTCLNPEKTSRNLEGRKGLTEGERLKF